MAPAAAPQRAPRPAPIRDPHGRPELRVVDGIDDARSPRSFGGLVGTLSVIVLFFCVFGVVVFQVLLVQTQAQLDDLSEGLTVEQARAEALGLETATLESPERIVAAANGLGMITPSDIVWLEHAEGDDAAAVLDPATEPVGTTTPPTATDPTAASVPAPPPSAPTGTDPTTSSSTPPANAAPGPPYTAENNWGAGGPTTTAPRYTAENNWGADLASTPGATP